MIEIIHGHGNQAATLYRITAVVWPTLGAGDERRLQHLGERLVACLARDPLRGQHVVDSASPLVPSFEFFA